MKDLYDTYVEMLGLYIDSREAYKQIRATSANGTHIKEAKTIMDFNKSQMQIALDKYLLQVVKGGVHGNT